jgi:sodium-coupled monocarboxylate transporter 8/12
MSENDYFAHSPSICIFQGAIAGFFSSLIFTLWLGIGAQIYKPFVPKAPVSTDGCPVINSTTVSWLTTTASSVMDDMTTAVTMTAPAAEQK